MQIPDLSNSIPPVVGGLGADPQLSEAAQAGQGANTTGGDTSARLKKACQEFEGQFFDLMLQEMRKTIPKDTLLGDDGHTQEIFTGMMDDQIAQDMAKHGGPNDLAEQLYRQISGASSQPAPTNPASTPPLLGAGGPLGQGVRAVKRAASTQDDNETSR